MGHRMRWSALALAGALGWAGCAHEVDRDTACRLVQLEKRQLQTMSARDLALVARGTPAFSDALSGYEQQVSAGVIGGLALATIAAVLVYALAEDVGVNENARNVAYGIAGGAIGLTAVTLLLGFTSHYTTEKARAQLRWWADKCP